MVGQWHQAAAALVEAVIPADPAAPANWPVCAVLLPHARAVLDLTSGGTWRIAQYLGYSGNYPAARDLFQLIGDAHREDDSYAEHREPLTTRANLAYFTGEPGDAAAARDRLAALLPVAERVLGPEHPETLTTRASLAYFTGEAGDAAAARDQFAALLPLRERVLGPEHPDTLTIHGDLSYWTGRAGDAATARDQFAALLPVRSGSWRRAPGDPDRPRQSGGLDRAGGDPAAARDQFAALLPVLEKVLGLEHPGTLITRGRPRPWTGRAGDPAAARDQFAVLLPVRSGSRPRAPGHPDRPRQSGALDRGGGGCGRRARPVRRAAAGGGAGVGPRAPGHPDYRAGLARWTGEAGDAAAARDQFAALVPLRERVLGAEDPDTLTTRNSLASWTEQVGGNAEPGVD